MNKQNLKKLKYLHIILLILAIILISISIFSSYSYLNQSSQGHNGTPIIYFIVYFGVLFIPVLELILLLICLGFVFKDKSWTYLVTGFVSLYIIGNSIKIILQRNVEFNLVMILTSIFWIVLIILSFYIYIQRKKS